MGQDGSNVALPILAKMGARYDVNGIVSFLASKFDGSIVILCHQNLAGGHGAACRSRTRAQRKPAEAGYFFFMATRSSLIFFLVLVVWDAAAAESAMTLGFHAHDPKHIEAAARTGYTAIRLWDTGTDWASLAPQPHLWKFERIDEYLVAGEKARLKVLWTLGNTPRWASSRPNEKCAYGFGCAAVPANIEDWRRYVRIVATTFRGRIECYEPWNEASFPSDPIFKQPGAGGDTEQFFSGSVDDMVSLARVAYEEIKRADPQACVLSPSFHSSGNWVEKFDRFLDAGGGKYFDVASQHFYYGEEPEQSVPVIRAVRQVLAKHGLSQVQIWDTEVGVAFSAKAKEWSGISEEDLVYALTLRTYLINASEGVPRIYWYAWDNGISGFFDATSHRDFGSKAATAVVNLFDQFESASCQPTGNLWQCRVLAGGKRFKVVWLAGKNIRHQSMVFDQSANRWGRIVELIPAGQQFSLDGRPVIIADER
jgi:hypothetical protein